MNCSKNYAECCLSKSFWRLFPGTACYWEYKRTPIVWHGKGSRVGNKILYSIKHTLYYPRLVC